MAEKRPGAGFPPLDEKSRRSAGRALRRQTRGQSRVCRIVRALRVRQSAGPRGGLENLSTLTRTAPEGGGGSQARRFCPMNQLHRFPLLFFSPLLPAGPARGGGPAAAAEPL